MKLKSFTVPIFGLVIGGLIYWFQPYNEPTVLGYNIWLIMGIAAFAGSIISMLMSKIKALKLAVRLSLGIAAAILARIVFDTVFWDSSSHNLAPLEILVGLVVSFPSACAGALLVQIARKLLKS